MGFKGNKIGSKFTPTVKIATKRKMQVEVARHREMKTEICGGCTDAIKKNKL